MITKEIHDVLNHFGYARIGYDPRLELFRYKGSYTYNGYTFEHEIQLTPNQEDFLTIPKVVITGLPKGIPERMPHFEANSRLCYLDQEGVYLDPFQPVDSMHKLIRKIHRSFRETIDKTIEDHSIEHAIEFAAYWQPSKFAFLGTKDPAFDVYRYKSLSLKFDEDLSGFICLPHNDESSRNNWFDPLFDFVDKDSIQKYATGILIESNELPLIKPGENWPPSNLVEYLKWFQNIDSKQYWRLIRTLEANIRGEKLLVFFRFANEHQIGFQLSPSKNGYKKLKHSARKDTKNSFENTLKIPNIFESFERFGVEDTTAEFILKRNTDNTLQDKQILMIGAGTIGGYLGQQLIQNGAGQGDNGKLVIYDDDFLQSGNIGRHILGSKYLGQRKSYALKHYLQSEFFGSQTEVIAHDLFDYQKLQEFSDFDLVIDVTGNSQFSTLLSSQWHKLEASNRPPAIIHGWIDASGEAVRALLDDGSKACYYCILKNTDLKPYLDGETAKSIRRSCAGSSYFEFPSNVSVTSAGLTLNLTLSFFHGEVSPKFKHIPISERVKRFKARDVAKTKGCPCCQI